MSVTLAHCEGYRVLAADGFVGEVERPLFPPDGKEPDYLVVRVRRRVWGRVPVVSTALVFAIDPARGLIWVRGDRERVAGLPEHLPLAI
jgi:hypothetical protein